MPLFGKRKRVEPEQVPYLVVRYTRECIPKIRKYLETDYPSRQEGVKGFSTLIKELHRLIKKLSEQLPEIQYFRKKGMRGSLSFVLFLGMTSEWTNAFWEWKEKHKKELELFLEREDAPLDKYGNIKFVVYMYSPLVFLLDFSYRGLFSADGIITGFGASLLDPKFDEPEYTQSEFRSTYDHLNIEILEKGLIKTLGDLRRITPLIDELEKKLAQFPSNDELEAMLK